MCVLVGKNKKRASLAGCQHYKKNSWKNCKTNGATHNLRKAHKGVGLWYTFHPEVQVKKEF